MQDLNKVETESFIQRNIEAPRKRFLWKIVSAIFGILCGIILLSVLLKYGSTYSSTNRKTDDLMNAVNASVPNEETMAGATPILNLTTQGLTIEDQTPNFNLDNNMGSTTTAVSIEPDSGAKHIVGKAVASKDTTPKEGKKILEKSSFEDISEDILDEILRYS